MEKHSNKPLFFILALASFLLMALASYNLSHNGNAGAHTFPSHLKQPVQDGR